MNHDESRRITTNHDESRRITTEAGDGKLTYSCVGWVKKTIFYSITSPKDPIPVLRSKLLMPGVSGPGYNVTAIDLSPRTPPPLARKLVLPEEVAVGHIHTMVFRQAPALGDLGRKPCPAILWIHGGPSGCDTWSFSARPQFLANLGFVVITVDYRGSYGFGLDHHDAVFGSTEGTAFDTHILPRCV